MKTTQPREHASEAQPAQEARRKRVVFGLFLLTLLLAAGAAFWGQFFSTPGLSRAGQWCLEGNCVPLGDLGPNCLEGVRAAEDVVRAQCRWRKRFYPALLTLFSGAVWMGGTLLVLKLKRRVDEWWAQGLIYGGLAGMLLAAGIGWVQASGECGQEASVFAVHASCFVCDVPDAMCADWRETVRGWPSPP
jgi:hypothetical protein